MTTLPLRVHAVDLKNRLCDIETDCRDCLHALLLRIMGALTAPHIHGARVPVEEPSTASIADSCTAAKSIVIRSRYTDWKLNTLPASRRRTSFVIVLRSFMSGALSVHRRGRPLRLPGGSLLEH
jgi:hypothetical protein